MKSADLSTLLRVRAAQPPAYDDVSEPTASLLEHVPALVALLEACEVRRDATCLPSTIFHAGCWSGYHVAGCPVAKADELIAKAIASVHAIGDDHD